MMKHINSRKKWSDEITSCSSKTCLLILVFPRADQEPAPYWRNIWLLFTVDFNQEACHWEPTKFNLSSIIWCSEQNVTHWKKPKISKVQRRNFPLMTEVQSVSDDSLFVTSQPRLHLHSPRPQYLNLVSVEFALHLKCPWFFLEINEVNSCGIRRITWIRCILFWSGRWRTATSNTSSPHFNTWILLFTIHHAHDTTGKWSLS